jgi:hypothetical protein
MLRYNMLRQQLGYRRRLKDEAWQMFGILRSLNTGRVGLVGDQEVRPDWVAVAGTGQSLGTGDALTIPWLLTPHSSAFGGT